MKRLIKRLILCLPVLLLIGTFAANAAPTSALELPSKEAIAHMTTADKQALVDKMNARVEEIKSMDKSQMTREERKALRAELKAMHKEARAVTGVYISVGALIIIILLLIIIL